MKLFSRISVVSAALILIFSISASAYKPVYDQMADVRWFQGYNPDSGLSVISDVAKGVNLKFKYGTQMWANRVVVGYQNNLKSVDPLKVGTNADKEGIYMNLQDIKWDVPKATLSNPEPFTSLMVGLANGEGGWSDRRALLFWIVRDKNNKYKAAVLRGRESTETAGMSEEESTKNFWAMDYTELPQAIGSEINFYLRRTSSTQWTLNINDNKIVLDDKTIVSERFTDLSDTYISLGTWSSSGPVECTITELWSYGCIEYSKKVSGNNVVNPAPAFVQKIKKAEADAQSSVSSKASTSSKKTNVTVSSTTNTTVSTASENISDTSSAEETLESQTDESQPDDNSSGKVAANASGDKNDGDKQARNVLIPVMIGLIALVLIGGGVGFYFMFLKKKPEGIE